MSEHILRAKEEREIDAWIAEHLSRARPRLEGRLVCAYAYPEKRKFTGTVRRNVRTRDGQLIASYDVEYREGVPVASGRKRT